MASLGHIAVGMAAGRLWTGLGASSGEERKLVALVRSMVAFSALSMAPDLDVLAFRFGIPYAAPFGHRGAAHSICAALGLALIATLTARLTPEQVARGQTRARLWLLCAVVAVSHGMLDTLTNGGLGIALWWPFSNHRFFAPWSPIAVAPIGAHMLSARGLRVVMLELLQFSPVLAWSLWPRRDGPATESSGGDDPAFPR